MSRINFRCSKCGARHVFQHIPDTYKRPKKCRNCGSEKFRRDSWMNNRDTKADSCNCAGYVHVTNRVWPHRRGSLYCWFRKDGSQRMEGDSDFKDIRLES